MNMIVIFIEGIILTIISILFKIYFPKFKGFMGEFWVKTELGKLPKDKYIVLNDIMIKDENGTHQIDHLVLSTFGIFVIEMKNYHGLIKGKEFDNKWCHYLGHTKYYFMNPIHQNYGHMKSLANLVKLDDKYFISIICFANQAKIAVKSNSIVTQVDYLKKEILKYSDTIMEFDIKQLANTITRNSIIDKKMRKQHIKDIHTKMSYKEELESNMICPKCRNKLVTKNGKYGKFVGCSNYPKCKYIKK